MSSNLAEKTGPSSNRGNREMTKAELDEVGRRSRAAVFAAGNPLGDKFLKALNLPGSGTPKDVARKLKEKGVVVVSVVDEVPSNSVGGRSVGAMKVKDGPETPKSKPKKEPKTQRKAATPKPIEHTEETAVRTPQPSKNAVGAPSAPRATLKDKVENLEGEIANLEKRLEIARGKKEEWPWAEKEIEQLKKELFRFQKESARDSKGPPPRKSKDAGGGTGVTKRAEEHTVSTMDEVMSHVAREMRELDRNENRTPEENKTMRLLREKLETLKRKRFELPPLPSKKTRSKRRKKPTPNTDPQDWRPEDEQKNPLAGHDDPPKDTSPNRAPTNIHRSIADTKKEADLKTAEAKPRVVIRGHILPEYDGTYLKNEIAKMNASSEPQEIQGRIRTIKQKLGELNRMDRTPEERAEEGTLKAELAALEKNRHDSKSEISIEAKEKAEATLLQLEKMDKEVSVELEKKGLGKIFRNVGEWYKNVPFSTKILVAAGLATGAALSGGVLAIPLVSAIVGRSFLASAATFVGMEALLSERKKSHGETWWNKHPTRYAGLLAAMVFIGGGSRGLDSLGEFFGTPADNQTFRDAIEPFGSAYEETLEISEKGDVPLFTSPHVVQPGENVWNILKEKTVQFSLDEGRKTYFIDHMKDVLAGLSPEKIRELGIESGDINLIRPGERIDFSHVLGTEQVGEALTEARSISDDTVASILKRNEVLASFEAAEKNTVLEHTKGPPSTPYVIDSSEVSSRGEVSSAVENSSFLRHADIALNETIDEEFGSSGFLGFGAKSGLDSPGWLLAKDAPVAQVLSGNVAGIEKDDLIKMSNLIRETEAESGLHPTPTESTHAFLRRGTAEIIKSQSIQ